MSLADELKRKETFPVQHHQMNGHHSHGPAGQQGKEPAASGGQIHEMKAGLLVRKYVELYAQTRLETMEALDSLPELDGLDDLKSKLLFSVIVVSGT